MTFKNSNTEVLEPSWASITNSSGSASSSNQYFEIDEAGTYLVEADAPAYYVGYHQLRLARQTGDSFTTEYGTSEYCPTGHNVATRSFVRAIVTITSSIVLKLEHYVGTTQSYGNGLGVDAGSNNVYTRVKITKLY